MNRDDSWCPRRDDAPTRVHPDDSPCRVCGYAVGCKCYGNDAPTGHAACPLCGYAYYYGGPVARCVVSWPVVQPLDSWNAYRDDPNVERIESDAVTRYLTDSVWHAAIADATRRGMIRATLVSTIATSRSL